MVVDGSIADEVGAVIGTALEGVRLGGNCEEELISAAAGIADTFVDAIPGFDARRSCTKSASYAPLRSRRR